MSILWVNSTVEYMLHAYACEGYQLTSMSANGCIAQGLVVGGVCLLEHHSTQVECLREGTQHRMTSGAEKTLKSLLYLSLIPRSSLTHPSLIPHSPITHPSLTPPSSFTYLSSSCTSTCTTLTKHPYPSPSPFPSSTKTLAFSPPMPTHFSLLLSPHRGVCRTRILTQHLLPVGTRSGRCGV